MSWRALVAVPVALASLAAPARASTPAAGVVTRPDSLTVMWDTQLEIDPVRNDSGPAGQSLRLCGTIDHPDDGDHITAFRVSSDDNLVAVGVDHVRSSFTVTYHVCDGDDTPVAGSIVVHPVPLRKLVLRSRGPHTVVAINHNHAPYTGFFQCGPDKLNEGIHFSVRGGHRSVHHVRGTCRAWSGEVTSPFGEQFPAGHGTLAGRR